MIKIVPTAVEKVGRGDWGAGEWAVRTVSLPSLWKEVIVETGH